MLQIKPLLVFIKTPLIMCILRGTLVYEQWLYYLETYILLTIKILVSFTRTNCIWFHQKN